MEKPFVLVADDNESTRTLITALLQREFTVDPVEDGFSALERLKQRRYAAIVLDVLMPGSDGYQVLDFLTAEQPEMLKKVIVLTAAASDANLNRARSYGVRMVLPKPFEIDILLAAVTECCEGERGPGFPLFSSGMFLLLAEMLRRVP